ncbi:MAG TPA: PQQ-binding-like beta-propeller repeat protein, partial [Gemmatimonadales bacterium]|nr:PQQ-binding-like beta-propeller repeat protein [Gemmatimonadales bacterium]
MKRIRAWSLAVVLGAVNAACAYNRPIPEAPLAVAGGPEAPLTERWLLRANRGLSLPLALRDGWLFGVGIDRRVVAMDLASGKLKWAYRLDGPALSGVLLHDDTLISASERPGGEVVALMPATGRRGWKRNVGWVGAPLALIGDVVIAQTRTKGTWGLDASTGHVKWRLPLGGGRTTAIPGGEGSAIFSTLDSVYRVDVERGTVLARVAAPGSLAADWRGSGRGVVAGTGEGELVLLDPGTLAPVWRQRLDAPVLVSPFVLGDTAWTATQGNTVYRTDLTTGATTVVLRHPTPITAPLSSWDGLMLVGDAKGIVTAYGADGAARWRLAVGTPVELAPMPYEDDLIV